MADSSTQQYKSIYFSSVSDNQKGRTITIAFSDDERDSYNQIKNLSSPHIREIVGIKDYESLVEYSQKESRSTNNFIKYKIQCNLNKYKREIASKDITFVGSKQIPFQRWYPYIEGYSPDFIYSLLDNYKINESSIVYDPFVGTGTTLFACDNRNIKTIYSEVNPLLQFLIDTKKSVLDLLPIKRLYLVDQLKLHKEKINHSLKDCSESNDLKISFQLLFGDSKYFDDKNFSVVLKIKSYIEKVKLENEMVADLLTTAVLSSLLLASRLKKAGDVRFKNERELKKERVDFLNFFSKKLDQMAEDIQQVDLILKEKHEFLVSNAKFLERMPYNKIDAVITSPPYLNGTNYFRNTKIELWFLGYIKEKNDLRTLRDAALTSAINDVKKRELEVESIQEASPLLKKTLDSLEKKQYDTRLSLMVLSYFEEMFIVFSGLQKHLTPGAKILVDIGDSIFAGVHVATDDILIEVLHHLGYRFDEKVVLRKRRSRNKAILSQVLLVFTHKKNKVNKTKEAKPDFQKQWNIFKKDLPHQIHPFSKRNWGHRNHSICSYQGKLKPSIAHNLVKTFVPQGGKLLDPFSGVGTIPFEGALNGIKSYAIDISKPAYYISSAKLGILNFDECQKYIRQIEDFISKNHPTELELSETKSFGYNKKLQDYYEEKTLGEIILARRFIRNNPPTNSSEMAVVSSLLHILHGNRPYALSRRSHPIVPYAPSGEFEYRRLIPRLKKKVDLILKEGMPENFVEGRAFHQDILSVWPQEICDLDAIITSPPFFDSTRFYFSNWIRIWFSGWSSADFKQKVNSFVEEKQKINMGVYETVFRQSRERLKKDGVLVLHLGKSKKCDMAAELIKVAEKWFRVEDVFDESVAHCESHGIRDKGTVTSHQYVVLR